MLSTNFLCFVKFHVVFYFIFLALNSFGLDICTITFYCNRSFIHSMETRIYIHTYTCMNSKNMHIHIHPLICTFTLMHIQILARSHACTFTHLCIFMHVHSHTCTFSCMCICTHACLLAHTIARVPAYRLTCKDTNFQMNIHVHAQTYMDVHMHTHACRIISSTVFYSHVNMCKT